MSNFKWLTASLDFELSRLLKWTPRPYLIYIINVTLMDLFTYTILLYFMFIRLLNSSFHIIITNTRFKVILVFKTFIPVNILFFSVEPSQKKIFGLLNSSQMHTLYHILVLVVSSALFLFYSFCKCFYSIFYTVWMNLHITKNMRGNTFPLFLFSD